jgi:hypothetical protein
LSALRSSLLAVEGQLVHTFTTKAGNEVRVTLEPDGSTRAIASFPDGRMVGDGVVFPTAEDRNDFREHLVVLLDVTAEGAVVSTDAPFGARALSAMGAVEAVTQAGVPLSPPDYPDMIAALDAVERAAGR